MCGWAGFIHAMTGATYSFMTEAMHRQFYIARKRSMSAPGAIDLDAIEVIIPNLKKRYSGGTAVNRTIAPLIAERCDARSGSAPTGRRGSPA